MNVCQTENIWDSKKQSLHYSLSEYKYWAFRNTRQLRFLQKNLWLEEMFLFIIT